LRFSERAANAAGNVGIAGRTAGFSCRATDFQTQTLAAGSHFTPIDAAFRFPHPDSAHRPLAGPSRTDAAPACQLAGAAADGVSGRSGQPDTGVDRAAAYPARQHVAGV